MKRMKKAIALILIAAALIPVLLVGCTGTTSTSGSYTAATAAPGAMTSGENDAGAENNAAETEAAQAANNEEENMNPVVTIEMEKGGIITVELYPDMAPNTVNNFISLVSKGFYDGVIFHRVIPGFMIQGGDHNGNGRGGPGYAITGEFASNGFTQNTLAHVRGVISMARATPPDSAGSQFFIMVDTADYLDGDYAAFGMVTSGMEVVDEIVNAKRDQFNKPYREQRMKKVTVDTKGITYPEPEKVG